ncbi:variable surface lipoprotein, partial [Mycoplasmopsis bovis]
MNKVNKKFLTVMGGIITSLALPIVAASCNNKNQKETGKENKNKNIVDTIPSDNTHSAN